MSSTKRMDPWLLVCSLVSFLGLGGFLLWAFVAPLSEGVTTGGQIIVEQNRKTLQHLEGGILRAIYVQEGDLVEEGEVLFEIDALAITANRDQIAYERAAFLANGDRLQALLNGKSELDFASKADWSVSSDDATDIEREQSSLFREQSLNHRSRLNLLNQRIESLKVGETQRNAQVIALNNSIDAVDQEIELTEQLVSEQLAEANALFRLQREKAQLQTEVSGLDQQILEIGSQIVEIEKEILQIRAEFRQQISQEMLETRTQIAKTNEQLKAIEDAVVRSQLVAPNAGKVLNLKFSTIGGVVQPGEPIMEIVPESSGTWAAVQITPNDRDTITEGMNVRVRLSGFKSWQTPDISGTITTISADLKQMPETGTSFYEARIQLSETDMQSSDLPPVLPGMPVEAFIAAGGNRTLASYLVEPIAAHIRKGLSSG